MNPIRAYVQKCHEVVDTRSIAKSLGDYKEEYYRAAIPLLFEEYVAFMVTTPVVVSLLIVLFAPISDVFLRLAAAVLGALLSFFLVYIYPLERIDSRKKRIDAELPLALNYMAAIMGSGAPPITAFSMVARFEEYEEMSTEAKKIVRDTDVLGMDLPRALTREADNSPSQQLREIMKSLRSEIISGGNITQFFEEKARDRMAHYARQQNEYKQASDTLASIYLVVALVAPLLFITGIAIMDFTASSGIGDILGTEATPLQNPFEIFNIGVFVGIPLINLIFIIIVKTMQPEVV
ncbi:MAG: type II secretion system F family protein [Candidatus Diapherotrites archaeon]|nr:type II secretion system F family protein [Candidatus Diapherotrites archaeon]